MKFILYVIDYPTLNYLRQIFINFTRTICVLNPKLSNEDI